MAALSLGGWALAGVAFGVVWPWLQGTFFLGNALRLIFGITVVGGSVTTAFVFFSVEHVWRVDFLSTSPGAISARPGMWCASTCVLDSW
jgi:hypothetical protein